MKKVLLSLSILAATVFAANAQGTLVPVYGGNPANTADSVNSENGFAQFEGTAPTDFTIGEVTEVGGNIYLKLHGTGTYYVWGSSNGRYNADGDLVTLGYTGAATGYVSFRAKASATYPKSKLKIALVTLDGKTFGGELAETGSTTVAAPLQLTSSWKVFNIAFNTMRQEDANGNQLGTSPVYPTAADLANVGQINVILNVQSCAWDPTANGGDGACIVTAQTSEVCVDDIYLSQSSLTTITSIPVVTSTRSAAANIASTKVFPNPTTGEFTAQVSLVNNANVTIIVTDMMGKQVASKVAANGSASFETAGLAKGMYTVTYVLDGTPAKTELVVVK